LQRHVQQLLRRRVIGLELAERQIMAHLTLRRLQELGEGRERTHDRTLRVQRARPVAPAALYCSRCCTISVECDIDAIAQSRGCGIDRRQSAAIIAATMRRFERNQRPIPPLHFSEFAPNPEVKKIADPIPSLSISTEKICFVVMKAREFDVKDADTSFCDDGYDPVDDRMIEVLEDRPDDPVEQELVAFIEAMSEDEQVDLVTLTWLGRGDGTLADWDDLRAEAARVHNKRTASYLLGEPLLPDYLEEALAAFGRSCDEFEKDHL
jgi:hypothetical protein